MAATELRRIIQTHVDPQHREQATKLLDAILAGGAHIGGPGLMPVSKATETNFHDSPRPNLDS